MLGGVAWLRTLGVEACGLVGITPVLFLGCFTDRTVRNWDMEMSVWFIMAMDVACQ